MAEPASKLRSASHRRKSRSPHCAGRNAGKFYGFRVAQPGLRIARGIAVAKRIRGVAFEENLNNSMGLEFYNLSHRFGYQSPNWPYFEDVKIERIHYMAKSGVLSQRITTSMHNTTHIDAPAHVIH